MNIPTVETKHKLRIAREHAGFGRDTDAFADKIGVSRATVSSYENGHVAPNRRTLIAWATVTDVPVWWLEGADGPEPGDVTDRYLDAQVIHLTPERRRAGQSVTKLRILKAA